MSGRRPWGGYGLALGLVFLAAGCAQKAKPPVPEPAAAAQEKAEVAPPAAAPAPAPVEEAQEATLHVKGIKLVDDEGQTGIFVKLSRTPDKVESSTLQNPSRLVIDAHGPVSKDLKAIERTAVDDPRVSRVRVGKQDGRLRITVDLKGATPKYAVNDLKTMVVAFLGERSGNPTPARSQVLYAEGGEAPAMAAAGSAAGPKIEMAEVEPPATGARYGVPGDPPGRVGFTPGRRSPSTSKMRTS